MNSKVTFFTVSLLAALLVTQTVLCEENERPDVLFIRNPDTFPKILSPSSPLLDAPFRNLVCTAAACQRVCRALNYRFGRCNVNRVCVCSNF